MNFSGRDVAAALIVAQPILRASELAQELLKGLGSSKLAWRVLGQVAAEEWRVENPVASINKLIALLLCTNTSDYGANVSPDVAAAEFLRGKHATYSSELALEPLAEDILNCGLGAWRLDRIVANLELQEDELKELADAVFQGGQSLAHEIWAE
ncbi:hypothetical protein HDU93_006933 [Gonapodya sp. JEL0774]|nr:hypothetical protein HDU93_006933 [Gonapodya sp. JEL0774]